MTSCPTARRNYADGYPSLAAFMASDRDRTALIFKRFDRLSARNLLYLQSQLAELQMQLDDFDEQDRGQPCARDWSSYEEKRKNSPQRTQILKDIREVMFEYKTLLAMESTLSHLPAPESQTLKAFRLRFHHGRPYSEESFPILGGASRRVYDDQDDLVVLRHPESQDRLSSFAQSHLGFLFKDSKDSMKHVSGVGYASERKIQAFVLYFSTLLAAVLLIGAIVVLYYVNSPELKLGLIAVFTALFAASVGILTTAKRAEIFGATAAYAAVLVVFVSGELGS